MNRKVVLVIVTASLLAVVGCVSQGQKSLPASSTAKGPPRPARIVVTNGPAAFRDYDETFANTVQTRWYDLLDSLPLTVRQAGKVVVSFRLHTDGRITDLEVLENTCTEALGILCQKAVIDLQPYEPWPQKMRQEVEGDFRKLRFSFYYRE